MIRRLQLRNWRAYEDLDLELGPGATFVVASNGIGKTSLIMGAGWGLFGDASRISAAEEIRGDADRASVGIELRLPSGADLDIERSITSRGRVTIDASLGGERITSQEELDALLTSEFNAEPRVLAQLTMMIHGGAVETFQGEFDLQDHLAGVFGVTPLFEAARISKATADRAASALRKIKTTQRRDRRERDELVGELQAVIDRLEAANEARDRAAVAMNEAAELVRGAEQWARYREGLADRMGELDALSGRAASLLDQPVTSESVLHVLAREERSLEEAAAAAEAAAASAGGKVELIRTAISDLEDADALCPTCLRPLAQHEAERAQREHSRHIHELEAAMREAEEKAAGARDALAATRRLLAAVRELPVPLEPAGDVPDPGVDVARAQLRRRQEELQTLDRQVATLAASGEALQRALQELDEDEERERELQTLYREEALGLAAHQAFLATGNAITETYIEPLATEVANRWKRMFGSGGLSLSAEGRITRQVGTRTLDFRSLSGGEKVWALLLTRLLISTASTQAPFVWLDEPLEHLDPRLRRVVAGTLAKATSGTGLRQVVVTTYENEIARQLMEDVPSASLIYVTTSD